MKTKEVKMRVVNVHACGIDVGSRAHYVSVGQGSEHVKCFGVYTQDHQEMIAYLKSEKVQTIAMESTGNYWQTLYAALEEAGFEVFLVCGSQTKNVKGRKTDVQDCQWIQWLHSVGMLSNSFIPNQLVSRLKLHTRQRNKYIEIQSRIVNQIQRDLRLMNIRLEVALNDVTGKSGCAIIESILTGERNPQTLANLADWRVKKSKEEIAKALEGNWNEDLLLILDQHYREYKMNLSFVNECDVNIDKILKAEIQESDLDASKLPKYPKIQKGNKNKPQIDLQKYSYQYFGGVDLYAIEGVNQNLVLTLMSEVGTDINKFHSAKAFANWLHLTPNVKITGGKVISNKTQKGKNPLSQAFQSAANAIGQIKSNTHLVSFFKRIAFKKGRKEAITATAHKLAVIVFNMLTKFEAYKPYQKEINEEIERVRKLKEINKFMKKYNFGVEELQIVK